MTNTPNTENPIPAILKKDSTQVTLGKTTFDVTSGSSDVTVYADAVRSKAPGRRAPKNVTNRSIVPTNEEGTEADVFGAELKAPGNETPLIVTTGVIRPTRGAVPAAPAPVSTASQNKVPSVMAEILPAKTRFEVGEDTGDGWICVKSQSRLARFFRGVRPTQVAKFVGDVTYQDLTEAAKAEEVKKTVADIHVPQEGEVQNAFNTVASLAGKAQAVWIDTPSTTVNVGATAVSLAEQDKRQALRTPKAGRNKNAGILFGTLKHA